MINLPGLEPHEAARLIPMRAILVGYRGSITHGTRVEGAGVQPDIDLSVCYIPGLTHYFGATAPVASGKHIQVKEYDCAAYELRHFVALMAAANPDVISMLWMRPEHYLRVEPEAQMLIANRDLFTSKVAAKSFLGYARGQLKRMTAIGGNSECKCVGEFHDFACKLTEERGRGSAKKFATGALGVKRKALVEKHGYDCKNAAHLIRLLKMGIDFLQTGNLFVDRTGIDADLIIKIKSGAYTLDEIRFMADGLFAQIADAEHHSPLPPTPNMALIDKLTTDILCYAHSTEVVLRRQDLFADKTVKTWWDKQKEAKG